MAKAEAAELSEGESTGQTSVEIGPIGIDLDRMSALMDERGYNVATLAARAGLSTNTLIKLRGRRSSSVAAETVARLAAALLVSVDYLLGLSPVREASRNIPASDTLPYGAQELLALLPRLEHGQVNHLIKIGISIDRMNETARAAARQELLEFVTGGMGAAPAPVQLGREDLDP